MIALVDEHRKEVIVLSPHITITKFFDYLNAEAGHILGEEK